MTREEAIEKLKDAEAMGQRDPEAAGSMAHKVLTDLLTHLGYTDVVEAYNSVYWF